MCVFRTRSELWSFRLLSFGMALNIMKTFHCMTTVVILLRSCNSLSYLIAHISICTVVPKIKKKKKETRSIQNLHVEFV